MARILVVAGNPTQAQELASILEHAGFEAQTAPDAEAGFEHLAGGNFDAVLSHLALPRAGGLDLCRRVKADARCRDVQVVLLTGPADPGALLRGLEAGAGRFVTEELEPDQVVLRLRRVLSTRPAGAPPARARVTFRGVAFDVAAGREQLLDALLSALEDVVRLDQRLQEEAAR